MKFINAFQKIGLTIAAIVFSCSALVFSLSPAKADNPATINESGKIMMDQTTFIYNGNFYFYVLVWDTETGKSKMYNVGNGSLRAADINLPTSPLY